MVLNSSAHLKTTPGSHREKLPLNRDAPSSALAFDGSEARHENCVGFDGRLGSRLQRVVSDPQVSPDRAALGEALRLAQFSCARLDAQGRKGEHHGEKFRS